MKKVLFCLTEVLMVFCLVSCANISFTVKKSGTQEKAKEQEKPKKQKKQEKHDTDNIPIFDTGRVHKIDIRISGEDWDDLQADPLRKTKYKVDADIEGEVIEDVSFATKGTSSLLIASKKPDNMRYSFKIKFDHFDKDQAWHTLRGLHLQSSFADATYMKDYLSYSMFRRMGVPAPRTGYVWLTINGKDQGLYLAVEELDKQFLKHNSLKGGNLYKPEDDGDPADDQAGKPSNSCGADLIYTDDNVDSYTAIFDNSVTKNEPADRQRLIRCLKSMNNLQDLEDVLDTDEIIRYFTVQNFAGNYDSYTGPKCHNFDLYERDGKLSVFPWDYNLAFGAFPLDGHFGHISDSTKVVNQGIDTPLVCVMEDKRPLWRWIVTNEVYTEAYHKEMDNLITEYFESGDFEKEIDDIHTMIAPYVEKDPTAYYTPNEFETAYKTLRGICLLRAESIRRQLDGTLSTNSDLQSEADRVDASRFSIKDMGVIEE